jgi:hypothetical protein
MERYKTMKQTVKTSRAAGQPEGKVIEEEQ